MRSKNLFNDMNNLPPVNTSKRLYISHEKYYKNQQI